MAKKKLTLDNPDELLELGRDLDSFVDITQLEVLPTGVEFFDILLGIGGIPLGYVVEFFGPTQSGKTTMATHIAAETVKTSGVVYVDFESTFNREYASRLGLDSDNPRFLLLQPDTIEQAFSEIETLITTNQVRIVIIDSVATALPEKILGSDLGDTQVALRARVWNEFTRKLIPLLRNHVTSTILINHEIADIGKFGFGRPVTTPGGSGIRYGSAIRVEFRPSKKIKAQINGKDVVWALEVNAKVHKSKFDVPFKADILYLVLGRGFMPELNFLKRATDSGVVKQSQAIFKFSNPLFTVEHKTRGIVDTLIYIRRNPDVMNELKQAVLSRLEPLTVDLD